MDFRETFLRLTEYTIPFGHEKYLEPILKEYVPGIEQDEVGNYFIRIGESRTLFTTHLDTFSEKFVKINHQIEGDVVGTDGKTILGGDNKNGCTILFYLIEQGVPGTYYFFLGEEPILSGGRYGSKEILKRNPEFFLQFDRAVAFDRKQVGSVVTRQSARRCCSEEFADSLVVEMTKNGMDSYKDPNAYYTDTATFLDVIPEITNLSAGGWGEHTLNETSNMFIIEQVATAAAKVDWESLPTVRIPKKISTIKLGFEKINDKKLFKLSKKTFKNVHWLFENLGYKCLNIEEFHIGVDMVFSHWHKESEIIINIIGDDIIANDSKIGKFRDLKNAVGVSLDRILDEKFLVKVYHMCVNKNNFELDNNEMDEILSEYYSDSNELIDFLSSYDSPFDEYIQYDEESMSFKLKELDSSIDESDWDRDTDEEEFGDIDDDIENE